MFVLLFALIDSGADASLFHADVARDLLIDVESGRRQQLFGASGHPLTAYFHTVDLQIIGSPEVMTLEVGFTDDMPLTALLGQADFLSTTKSHSSGIKSG